MAGSFVGGTVFGGFGLLLGMLWADRFMPDGGLDALGPVIVGAAAGAWIGPPLTVWLFLKMGDRDAAAPTAALLVAALPTWGLVSLPSFAWLTQKMSGDAGPGRFIETVVLPLILLVPPAYVSRWLVLHNERVRSKREESSA
jgi:hypothetical protein